MYFGYDEEFEEYFCEVNLDEDEMEKFLTDSFQGGCPYYRLEDEKVEGALKIIEENSKARTQYATLPSSCGAMHLSLIHIFRAL